MKMIKNCVRFSLPALALSFGMGSAALAQTTMAPSTPASTSMKPSMMKPSMMKPATTAKAGAVASFKTVELAQAHCPGDTVVWSTMSKSHSYHVSTSKYYGKTKHGGYVCEKEATAAGYHASKS